MNIQRSIKGPKVLLLIFIFTALNFKELHAKSFSEFTSQLSYEFIYFFGHKTDVGGLSVVSGGGVGLVAGAILGAATGGPLGATGGLTGGLFVGMGAGLITGVIAVGSSRVTIRFSDEFYDFSPRKGNVKKEETEVVFLATLGQLKEDVDYYHTSGQYTENLESFLEDISLAGHTYSEPEIIASIEALSSIEINFELKDL